MKQQILTPNAYEFADLQYELSRDLDEPLSERTLRYWLRSIGIERDECGFYDFDDLQILRLWISLKPQLRTFSRFKSYLRRKINASESQQTQRIN